MKAGDLSPAESAFVERMKPHIAAGLSLEDAAAAVLRDDERLYLAIFDRDTGAEIRSQLAREVYERIRSAEVRP